MHPAESGRLSVTDETVVNFDMLQTGHGDMETARGAIPKLIAAYNRTPPMPAMIGEFCYEGHMQAAHDDAERYVFWGSMLSGGAGLTYGAAGVWHASVEGDPASTASTTRPPGARARTCRAPRSSGSLVTRRRTSSTCGMTSSRLMVRSGPTMMS
jgi:hypothetical protein